MEDQTLATFKIDKTTWKQFIEKAKGNNTNASALLKDFVQGYLDGSTGPSSPVDNRVDSQLDDIRQQIAELGDRLGKLSAV